MFSKSLGIASIGAITLFGILAACDSSTESQAPGAASEGGVSTGGTKLVLGAVTIDPDDNRKTYVQALSSLESGPFTNANAIEVAGNGVVMAHGDAVFVGLAEEPTWVRYSVDANGKFTETGRLSFLSYGLTYMDFGNTIVDDETAVSVLTGPKVAVIWNPKTMTITGEVDLKFLQKDGYDVEAWTVSSYHGLVYIPARYADWTAGKILPGVSMSILDPKTKAITATLKDDRCTSGGKVNFAKDGYGYVMGDGRNWSDKMFARAAGTTAPPNCLLRFQPGATTFDKDYFFTIPSLTGGRDSISELDSPAEGGNVAYAKMFYEDMLPAGVKPVDFTFWDLPVHKTWALELGNPPTAKEVDGLPFSALGFTPIAFEGKFYSGESGDKGATSYVYETDPATNRAAIKFKMDGYFYGLFKVDVK